MAQGLIDVGLKFGVRQLGVTASLISRWERGLGRPRAPYPRLLCELFETTADDLGLLGADKLDDDVNRRDAFRVLGGMAALAVTPSPGLTFGQSPDPEALEIITHGYRRLWATTPPEALLGPVLAHLHLATSSPQAATETAVLAGYCYRDLDRYDDAARCYRLAGRYAEGAGKPWKSFVLCEQSWLAMIEGDTERALAAVGRAGRLYRSEHARMNEAMAHARAGNSSRALSLFDKIDLSPDPEPPYIYPFTEKGLARHRGGAARMLGLPREAIPELESGLQISEGKRRARVLCDLAACHRQLGELDAAEAEASEALRLADALGSRRLKGRAAELLGGTAAEG